MDGYSLPNRQLGLGWEFNMLSPTLGAKSLEFS